MKIIDVSYIFKYDYHSGILSTIKYILKELDSRHAQVTLLVFIDSNNIIEFKNSKELIKILDFPVYVKQYLLKHYSTQNYSDFIKKYHRNVTIEFYMLSLVIDQSHMLFLKKLRQHLGKSLFTLLEYDFIPEFNEHLFSFSGGWYSDFVDYYNLILDFDRVISISDLTRDQHSKLFHSSTEVIPLGFDHLDFKSNHFDVDFLIISPSISTPVEFELNTLLSCVSQHNTLVTKVQIVGARSIDKNSKLINSFGDNFHFRWFDQLDNDTFFHKLSTSKVLLNNGLEGFSLNTASFLYNGREVSINEAHPLWKFTVPGSESWLRKLSPSAIIPTWANFCSDFFNTETQSSR